MTMSVCLSVCLSVHTCRQWDMTVRCPTSSTAYNSSCMTVWTRSVDARCSRHSLSVIYGRCNWCFNVSHTTFVVTEALLLACWVLNSHVNYWTIKSFPTTQWAFISHMPHRHKFAGSSVHVRLHFFAPPIQTCLMLCTSQIYLLYILIVQTMLIYFC